MAALLLLVPLGVFLVWPEGGSAATCGRVTTLRVSVVPEVADVVRGVASTLERQPADGTCVRTVLTTRPAPDVASDISRRAGQGLAARVPDVWIPDSSMWLAVARRSEVGRGRIEGRAQSLTRTPVVMAVTQDRAEALGWPGEQRTATELAGRPGGLKVALTDPRRHAPALATVLRVQASGEEVAPVPGRVASSLLAFARAVRVPLLGDRAPTQLVAERSVDAVPTSEHAVLAHNGHAQVRLAAVYDAGTPQLDYPFIELSADAADEVRAERRRAADRLRAALLADAGQDRFRDAGFRDRTGALHPRFGADQGVVAAPVRLARPPSDGPVRSVLSSWSTLGRRGRVLIAVDVSGSMAGRLPGSTLRKSDLSRQALGAVVEGVAPDSELGVWTFTDARPVDHRVLVPVGRVDEDLGGRSRREVLRAEVARIAPVPTGGTGLYDTTLRAFRAASRDFAYGKLNAVVVVTDGRNDDPGSLSLDRLLVTLKREFDGIRPVRIIPIAYGGDADLETLRRIADVTGGSIYAAPAAKDVGPILARALATL